MNVLISGAGIAGPCLAYWLQRQGAAVTIVERAPALRASGYIIDFWGAGFDVADRMGLMPEILAKGYQVREVRQVDRRGKRISGFPVDAFDRVTNGRFTSLPRGDLAAALYRALSGHVETIFGDGIVGIEETADQVRVGFERNPPRAFDLVVGADGLHSQVRRLVFGEEDRFERFLGMKVAAFTAEGYRPRDELTYVIHRAIGRQVARFAMRDDRTMFLFIFADGHPDIPGDIGAQKALLRERFAGVGWECPRILDGLEGKTELYMDRVSQIRMDGWTRGRVALVGDAAFCISLLGGQGSALAMAAAYILAGELKCANGDHAAAFARYEERLRTFIAGKQKTAFRFESFFAPHSRFAIFIGNQIMNLLAIPYVTELVFGREFKDAVELPEY